MLHARSLALLLLLLASPAQAQVWGKDKAQHLLVSLGLGGAGYAGLRCLGDDPRPLVLVLSTSLALVPGLLKEIYDAGQPGNRFSGGDLAWDAVGALSGALIGLGLDLLITRWRRPPAPRTRGGPRAPPAVSPFRFP